MELLVLDASISSRRTCENCEREGSGRGVAESEALERVMRLSVLSLTEFSLSTTLSPVSDADLSNSFFAAIILPSRRTASTPDLLARVAIAFASTTSFSRFAQALVNSMELPAPFALLNDCIDFSMPVTIARMSLEVVILSGCRGMIKNIRGKSRRYHLERVIDEFRRRNKNRNVPP